jgi:hypothetical protein
MCTIEFLTRPNLLDRIPHPYPAGDHVPDWFKNMPLDFEHGGTLKRCPPFLAAMTSGYIIPAPADARLIMSADGELSASGTVNFLGGHFPDQMTGSPFAGMRVIKFENPWVIVTPPGYVCMITAPINRFELPFTALTGVVETDTYYREVHLPMACTMRPGQEYKIARGAPMIQVIPMRRDEWSARTGLVDPARRDEQERMFKSDVHFYKQHFWRKSHFT